MSIAENGVTSTEIIDLVYEWSPEGTSIQIGKYNISEFDTVWMDSGNGNIVQTNSNDIKTGNLVKVYLVNQDENDFWLADRLVVLSGTALDSAIKSLPDNKRDEKLHTKENEENIPSESKKQIELPVLDNGVWRN
jgi:hypothetical protein